MNRKIKIRTFFIKSVLLYRREKLSGEVFHETQENFCRRSGGGDAAVVCGMREQGHPGRLFRAAGEQTTEERTTEPQTNEDGSLVKPKNAVSVSDDVKIKTYSGTSLIEIGNRVMEPYGNAYKNMKAYADALNRLKAEMPDTKAYCLMAPTAIEFYAPSKYNTGVSKSQYEGMCYIYEQLKDITPVNAYAEMAAHTDEYLYFRSDHHWTTLGAYYAYRTFAKVAGFTPVDKNTLQTGKLSPFLGLFYKDTKSTALSNDPDYVEYFIPPVNTTAIASDTDAR